MNDLPKEYESLWLKKLQSFEKETPQEKADTLRFFLSQYPVLKQSNCGFDEPWSLELQELEARRQYSQLMDSKTGVNNYADAILSLRKGFKNDSMKWKCHLKPEDLKKFLTTDEEYTEVMQKEYTKLAQCIQQTKPRQMKDPKLEINKQEPLVSQPSQAAQQPSFDWDTSHLFKETESASRRASFSKIEGNSVKNPNSTGSLFSRVGTVSQWHSSSFAESQQESQAKKKIERTKLYPWERSKGTPALTTTPSFRTASHQLAIDNAKRGATSGVGMYGGSSKRSLGPRGVKSGFVPPVKMDSDEHLEWDCSVEASSSRSVPGAPNGPPHSELLADSRLKNVDPKMVELVMNEILDSGPTVSWDDIAGLEVAKNTVQEVVVWPMLRPDIFTGLRGPSKGILLFGPPGTGKTMIGKCIASQSRSTFFSISASSLTSKWIGEGEKMVRAMFAVARCHQPAVIFIDEIDSLLTQRSDTEHESSRRIKTEFLVQLDGTTSGQDERLLLVGATNRPQELDEAARRRLVKRLYIPLPDSQARQQIMKNLLADQNHTLSDDELKQLSESTEGYSGADVANLCREAALGPIRSLDLADIERIAIDQVRAISKKDFVTALGTIRASVSQKDLKLYEEWNAEYGIRKAV